MNESIVRASCPTCGDIVVASGDPGLRLDEAHCRFLFDCPRCHHSVSRDVPSGILHILRAAGVQVVQSEPDLLSEAEVAEFLADFDKVDCLDELRRLGA